MKKIRLFYLFFNNFTFSKFKSEIIIMSACDDKQDEFLKNEYIFNLK